ncbi:helix-turn-helix transcriptional regulator [Enterococcus sp. HY326]|uniref:helix-turn-helix transcriptional regulator n=1 Tax=Enterococcus sp. HY326 TaxID=2971265 RepID=UPI00223F706D|nr:helix-turn-helix transcriptional regulator [Enterococcus sp. HY326]
MELATKLKLHREKRNLSQEEVAKIIKVSRQTISNWETGKTLPDINSLILVSNLYDISLDFMLKGDENYMNKIEKDTQDLVRLQKAVNVLKVVGLCCLILIFLYLLGHAIGQAIGYLDN